MRRLIYDHAGINLHAGKQATVYSRLSRAPARDRPAARAHVRRLAGAARGAAHEVLPLARIAAA